EKSECTFCGTCVTLCPTGVLTEKIKPYRGTATRVVSTICPFCGCGCNINLEVTGGQVVRARPIEKNSPNGVTLCVRGAYGYDFIHKSGETDPAPAQGKWRIQGGVLGRSPGCGRQPAPADKGDLWAR
ncbi:4Fe-4S binding protein, partial [Dehalococcoidia bacterium]|nr:4Fe-4S binding protein [Dehalococcoidia bacterium]